MKASLLILLLFLLVEVQCQQMLPYASFMGQILLNHFYIDISLLGTSDSDSVQCHTDLATCCNSSEGFNDGGWYFPNGSKLSFSNGAGNVYEHRTVQRVDLHRRNNANEPGGIYHCDIATNAVHDNETVVYVGLYTSDGGKHYNKYIPETI